ncbi:hypothetical protein HR059_06700 [Sinorhizobium meliloti WSM1022]|jgi:hypothetical protein|uniref:hypothetical protein n=1 Tax=Rhizobium meliloti TaxID=382 RepID=UPI000405B566|nr:hypothetical protein [Sinorhizobium meliloti]ASQ04149.1 hypothetical protein CDO23_09510 [Sinorhizobium meliloti]MCO6422967.1 hypothetical protein [Sinorhizobium meliloti]MDW9409647.1 hypothetical protein [Sinorhizobium meliloti]MDW9441062.1 hypothetical protein [Sinorhizobium meliloti]MDW9454891.1 hypothetical protein [Sinorhizobium meliloti]
MTQVVTISATTAAYAADALKPPTRLRGDGPVDEAITLLCARGQERAAVTKIRSALPLHLMLIAAERRLPQQTQAETLRRYLENAEDEDEDEDGGGGDRRREDKPAGDEQDLGEITEMLDRLVQGS